MSDTPTVGTSPKPYTTPGPNPVVSAPESKKPTPPPAGVGL